MLGKFLKGDFFSVKRVYKMKELLGYYTQSILGPQSMLQGFLGFLAASCKIVSNKL